MKGNFNIGNIRMKNPFLLAPLAGITDSPFRRQCKEQGAALVYSEMISAKGLYYNSEGTKSLLFFVPCEMPLIYQVFGSCPDIMAEAVRVLEDCENAGFDVNMGCPVPKVVKNGEGAALMKNPKLSVQIIKAMVCAEKKSALKKEREPKPVTVKCRTGWDKHSINVSDFACMMEEAGASAIAVHGRTGDQLYSGKADWQTIAEVKKRVGIPVIGSGDIYSAEDANRMLDETDCDFVMIARGALGNPWIFRDALALYRGMQLPDCPSMKEKVTVIENQFLMMIDIKGDFRALLEMRKHIAWYLKGLPGAAKMRSRINSISTVAEMRTFLNAIGRL